VEAIAERQTALVALDARLRAAEAAPEAISLEIRRRELEANERIASQRNVLDRNSAGARKLMESVFEERRATGHRHGS
jgi:site-specific DNA recombinase